MPDLQALLDQVDRLDQQATKGPWDHTVEWAEIGSGSDSVIHGYGYAHCDGCDEEIEGVDARVALSPEDAEFIALARTALPAMSKALRAVMDLEDESLDGDLQGYEIDQYVGYNQALRSVREAITDALGDDDA